MTDYQVIEIIDPEPLAMVRSFHCQICDKQHMHTGLIARVWVGDAGGYASNAAYECLLSTIATRATQSDIYRMWRRLWGDSVPMKDNGYAALEILCGVERIDLCEGLHVGQSR